MLKCVNKGVRTEFPPSPSDLTAPTVFAIGTPGSNTLPVTWTAPTQGTAVGYKVYEGTTPMGSIDWPATGMTVTGLTEETSYTLHVVTYDSAEESTSSNTDTASTTVAAVGVIFEDDFSSADLLSTNSALFTWDSTNKTGVVTGDPSCGGYTSVDDVFLWDSANSYCIKESAPLNGGSFDAKVGLNNLRFRYPAHGAAGAEMSEQRFHMSENGTTSRSAWLSYWLKVPSNWTRELVPVSGGANNKLLILGWGQGQSTDHAVNYPTDGAIGEFGDNEFRLELKDWPSAAGTEMEVELQARTMSDATHALTYYSFDGGLYQNFVTPTDQDRWMHIVFDLQASTDIDTADGHIRMYRKWDGDSTYVTIGVMNNKVISGGGKSGTGWGFGYFMGYANQEYPTQTEWFIDNVIFSTEDLRL